MMEAKERGVKELQEGEGKEMGGTVMVEEEEEAWEEAEVGMVMAAEWEEAGEEAEEGMVTAAEGEEAGVEEEKGKGVREAEGEEAWEEEEKGMEVWEAAGMGEMGARAMAAKEVETEGGAMEEWADKVEVELMEERGEEAGGMGARVKDSREAY